jgi:hypothetical protein
MKSKKSRCDQVVKLLSTARTRVFEKKKETFFVLKGKRLYKAVVPQLAVHDRRAQRQQGCEASEIMFRVLVHVSTCLLANFSPYARHWRLWRDVMITYFEVLTVRSSETHCHQAPGTRTAVVEALSSRGLAPLHTEH